MVLSNKLKNDLRGAASLQNAAERGVVVASIIAEALRTVGQDPILVGGSAVEFYTEGGYSTVDIDMVCMGGAPVYALMQELGFSKIGKDFINQDLELYVEFPSGSLRPSEQSRVIAVAGRSLRIISVEDLIVDRLCSFKFWQSAVDGVNAMLLLELGEADRLRIGTRAKEEDVDDALQMVIDIETAVIRKKMSRKQASHLITETMRKLKR